ncbi:MAG: hypothetical protein WCQ32_03295 [bacterium]
MKIINVVVLLCSIFAIIGCSSMRSKNFEDWKKISNDKYAPTSIMYISKDKKDSCIVYVLRSLYPDTSFTLMSEVDRYTDTSFVSSKIFVAHFLSGSKKRMISTPVINFSQAADFTYMLQKELEKGSKNTDAFICAMKKKKMI